MIESAVGAFLGALLTLLISIFIEYQRKAKLHLKIEDQPHLLEYRSAPASIARFVRVELHNNAMPRLLRWLGRSAAMQCHAEIQFYHHDDGTQVFSRPMPARWAGTDEPLSVLRQPSGELVRVFDPAKYNLIARRDCYPGGVELIDVAVRFDDETECFGWTNENYLPGKAWRNPEWMLPSGRYLVEVTVYSSGETIKQSFQLENSVSVEHFRLIPVKP